MRSTITKLLITICALIAITGAQQALAQGSEGTVTTTLTTHSSNGIFSSNASFTLHVDNTYKNTETGKISYLVTTERGKKVAADSIHVGIDGNDSKSYYFEIPKLNTGFYKINFMINMSDYDDTTRKAFGIKPDEIRSTHEKPADFDQFWQETKDDLAKVKPEYKLTELKNMEKNDHKVYMVEMKSYGNVTIRGYLTCLLY